jgi:predicted NACHT family NTPase
MILGKPGAGKTTFLKHLALQCIGGRFQAERIPVFITLKDFAEAAEQPNLLDYLIQLFVEYGIAPNTKIRPGFLESILNWNSEEVKHLLDLTAVEYLLNKGRFLFLLDGLDEVRESDSHRVLKQVQDFADQFYRNQFGLPAGLQQENTRLSSLLKLKLQILMTSKIAISRKSGLPAKMMRLKLSSLCRG